jgi:cob(I)alamin adenosyltransferase
MKVYTRGGDEGETSLFGGERVRKDTRRVEAFGAVDELNAALGLAGAEIDQSDLAEHLRVIQVSLFQVGAELATPDIEERTHMTRIGEANVEELEGWIDKLETELEPLRKFVLPGGSRGAALLHLARSICRRAERRLLTLKENEAVAPVLLRYLNRLSDLLFVMARVVNRRRGVTEPTWTGREG